MAAATEVQTKGTFLARRSELRLVYSPGYTEFHAHGNKTIHNGEVLLFKDARLDINVEQCKTRKLKHPPEVYIAWLKEHPLYGDTQEGFFEIQPAKPDPTPELDAIQQCVGFMNIEGIQEVQAAELLGHNRPAVLHAAEKGLQTIQDVWVAQEAAAAEKAAEQGQG